MKKLKKMGNVLGPYVDSLQDGYVGIQGESIKKPTLHRYTQQKKYVPDPACAGLCPVIDPTTSELITRHSPAQASSGASGASGAMWPAGYSSISHFFFISLQILLIFSLVNFPLLTNVTALLSFQNLSKYPNSISIAGLFFNDTQ